MAKLTGMNVYLNVSNTEKSRAFYEALGYKQTMYWKEWDVAVYDAGSGTTLVIGAAQSPDPEAMKWLANKPWGVGVIITQTVDDVDAIYAKAQKLGAEVEQPPTTMDWGDRTLQLVDPDGYSVWFTKPAPPAKPKKTASKKVKAVASKKTTKGKPSAAKGKSAKGKPKRR